MADDMLTSTGLDIPVAIASPMQAPTSGELADNASAMNDRNPRHSILASCPDNQTEYQRAEKTQSHVAQGVHDIFPESFPYEFPERSFVHHYQ